jgi:hypothetical protein
MLDGIASLITAVAALVTAVSGLLGVIYLFRRGSRRERKEAAKAALTSVPIVGDLAAAVHEAEHDD